MYYGIGSPRNGPLNIHVILPWSCQIHNKGSHYQLPELRAEPLHTILILMMMMRTRRERGRGSSPGKQETKADQDKGWHHHVACQIHNKGSRYQLPELRAEPLHNLVLQGSQRWRRYLEYFVITR
jgi:hypothetical protein